MFDSARARLGTAVQSRSKKLEWKADFGPALVVVLISVPLSMGIAIASGVPPVKGLITAVIGGLLIGSLAGSPLQISGPSAGLAVMVLDLVNGYGLGGLAVVVMLMGVIQLTAGFLRLGQVFRAVSPAVINGMLAGIGVLILSAQFHVMVGDAPKGSGLDNLLSIPEAVYKGVIPQPGDGPGHHYAALVGVVTLAVLVAVRFIEKGPLSKVPAPLAAVVVATIVVWGFALPVRHTEMPETVWLALEFPSAESLDYLRIPAIWGHAVALAFVASAETLLCATAVEGMHEGQRTNYDKELVAQGVGNSVLGILGSLPTTGVITRSTANVQAGAKSRASALMVGSWLFLLLAVIPKALEVIPRASLAALLVYVGYKLVRGRPYRELRRYGWSEIAIFVATVAVIVGVNLLTGIIFGLVLAALKLVISQRQKFHRFSIETNKDEAIGQLHVHLRGAASFLRLPKLAKTLESLPLDEEVHLHVDELEYIDHACMDLLDRWECDRLRRRAPVRVQWRTLHHRYHVGNPLDPTPDQHARPPEEQRLLDFLTPRRILIDPALSDKWQAIDHLCEHYVKTDAHVALRSLQSSVRQREKEASTCIGYGLMVPHGTIPEGLPMGGVLAVSEKGWDFDGADADGEKIHCILLLATPSGEAARHLAVLSAFARLFLTDSDLRGRLISAQTPEEVFRLLHDEEAGAVNYSFEERPA